MHQTGASRARLASPHAAQKPCTLAGHPNDPGSISCGSQCFTRSSKPPQGWGPSASSQPVPPLPPAQRAAAAQPKAQHPCHGLQPAPDLHPTFHAAWKRQERGPSTSLTLRPHPRGGVDLVGQSTTRTAAIKTAAGPCKPPAVHGKEVRSRPGSLRCPLPPGPCTYAVQLGVNSPPVGARPRRTPACRRRRPSTATHAVPSALHLP